MRAIRIALAIGVVTLGLLGVAAIRSTSQSDPIGFAPFTPLPHRVTTLAGVTFAQLMPSQLTRVRVSAAQALAEARRWQSFSGESPRITVDLGAFADSKNVPSVPAYLVIFDGVIVPNLGPKRTAPNHEDIEVVNAVTGRAIEGFSYH